MVGLPVFRAPVRLVVLISGNGSNLQAIIKQIDCGALSAEIVAVISNKSDAYGLKRAAKNNIPVCTLSHRDFESREQYDEALKILIDKYQPDLIILAGFMRILSNAFVEHYSHKMMNIHPSLLPKYKGLNTHQRAIDAGEKIHGCSVHFVTPELDDGPVILQASVDIKADDTADTLASRVHEQEHIIYPKAIQLFAEHKIKLV
ncbi:MAG: phosphoribosylglycinamide formyltransferase [Woeseiaceae bacterium]